MSLHSLLNRTVLLRHVAPAEPATRNAHGNTVRVPGPDSPPIPARRDQTSATENDADRDQQIQNVRYTLPLRVWIPGDPGQAYEVELTGRDRIVDGDQVFEVVGTPELVYRRRRPHHWEATARLVEG